MIREIIKMGDPRLLRVAQPVQKFDTPELHELISDMFEVMRDAKGVGLAAPQIGADLQLVIFGFTHSERYPDAKPVPETILLNPVITPLSPVMEEGWEGCLSVPGLRGMIFTDIRKSGIRASINMARSIDRIAEGFSRAGRLQHWYDHLIGKLYPMRITDFSKFGYLDVLFPGMDPEGDD